ncbi:MAG: oligosaccharide flippase family protein, partial [Chlamydiales bacterium]|nr:oligosaccharide flippase family protein [Chlamydiales bacterium]
MNENNDIRDAVSTNVIVSILTNVFYLFTRLFIPPFILSYVPLNEYGLWSYCFILISYLGMSVFGVTNVYVRYVAIYYANGEMDKINRLVSTGLITITLLCVFFLPILWWGLPWIIGLFKIGDALHSMAFILFFGTAVVFMIDLTLGTYGNLLHSLQRIDAERYVWTASYLVETLLIVIFLMNGMGIYGLLAAYFVRIFLAILLYAIIVHRLLPQLSISFRNFDRSMLKLFYHFGGIVQLSGILGVVNRSIEKIFSGLFLSMKATGLYEVGLKFPIMTLMIPGSVNAVFLPATAHYHAKEQRGEIMKVFLKGSRFINIITGMMMGFFAAFSGPLIGCWLGPDPQYQAAVGILAIFTVAYQMDVLTGPASAIYRSIEQPVKELWYGLSQFVFVIAAAAYVFTVYGASIMTINITVVSMMVLSAAGYLVFSALFLQVSLWEYFKQVIVPGFLPYLFAFALAYATQAYAQGSRWDLLYYLIVCLLLHTAIAGGVVWFLLC